MQLDDSWATFMVQRRAQIEKARLQRRSEHRREQRQQQRKEKPMPTAEVYIARAERERVRLLKVTEARRAKREAAGPAKKRGRPVKQVQACSLHVN